MPGGYLQNHPGRLPPSSCSDRAVDPPPAQAVPVKPRPSPARIRSPRVSSHCAVTFPSLPRSVAHAKANPSHGRAVLELRRRLAGVPCRHCPIAWTRSCASTSSTTSRKHACWEGPHHRESSDHRIYTDRSSSLISPPSSLLRPRRPSHRVRGEQAELLDPSSLSIAFHVVVSVAVRPRRISGKAPPSAIAASAIAGDQ